MKIKMVPTKPHFNLINGRNENNNWEVLVKHQPNQNHTHLKRVVSCLNTAQDNELLPLEIGGSWVQLQEESCLSEVNCNESDTKQAKNLSASSQQHPNSEVRSSDNGKPMKLRIKFTKTNMDPKFSPGTVVEVRSDEDGYEGSWYAATVVGLAGVGKFLVEYKSLVTDDETELLKEVANEQDVRPYPPDVPQSCQYVVLQEVDAWYNDGWWEGVISEVLDDMKYVVYFASSNEKLVYQHFNLRPHQNWVNGKWVLASQAFRSASCSMQKRPSNLKLRFKSPTRKSGRTKSDRSFSKGTMVEVRSDEQGYEGSWYTAIIIRKRNRRFLVEYLTLKTDDEKKFLREEADAQDIRPCPPKAEEENQYHMLQKVDAWYNDGWWVGKISKLLPFRKYTVYFETSREEIEFDHGNLRIHQEWVKGKWIVEGKKGI